MAIPRIGRLACASVVVGLWLAVSLATRAQDPPPAPTPVGADEAPDASGGQVLTQGPVHEAFAAPVVHNPRAGGIVAKPPPQTIQEIPPDQKPAGVNVQWIPGYWAWDTTRNDYLWVSGVWREPSPGTQWVPGYWNAVDDGYQWVPGSWMPAAGQGATGSPQATYLPAPPGTLENGPTSPQPGPNTVWTPGFWSWQGGGYAWRPGFWAAIQPGWVWMPAHYIWSPTGYLFVPGYWDLPVANRGLMFAPVYYPQPVYTQVGFAYTPSVAIVGSAMTSNLFVSVGTGQYLFGDYYASNFVSVGIVPWFSFSVVTGPPVFYDPLFSYYSVVNVRENPGWAVQVREAYALRRENIALRPPRTYAAQVRVMREVSITRNINVIDHRNMAMPLRQLAADRLMGQNLRLERVAAAERQQIRQQAAELHQMREQRVQLERRAAESGPASRPRTAELPRSPVGSHPAMLARAGGAGLAGGGHVGGGYPAAHPGGHPGAEGHGGPVARREAPAAGREARNERWGLGQPAAGHRLEMGGPAMRGEFRQPGRMGEAPRGRERPAPERERHPPR